MFPSDATYKMIFQNDIMIVIVTLRIDHADNFFNTSRFDTGIKSDVYGIQNKQKYATCYSKFQND